MRISDWSSDVCSSDLLRTIRPGPHDRKPPRANSLVIKTTRREKTGGGGSAYASSMRSRRPVRPATGDGACQEGPRGHPDPVTREEAPWIRYAIPSRSEEHTSELQSLMRISYAVFC